VGPRASLDGRKVSSPPGFDPGPTELPGPQNIYIVSEKFVLFYFYANRVYCLFTHINCKEPAASDQASIYSRCTAERLMVSGSNKWRHCIPLRYAKLGILNTSTEQQFSVPHTVGTNVPAYAVLQSCVCGVPQLQTTLCSLQKLRCRTSTTPATTL